MGGGRRKCFPQSTAKANPREATKSGEGLGVHSSHRSRFSTQINPDTLVRLDRVYTQRVAILVLSSERASRSKLGLSTGGSAKNGAAGRTDDHSLRVGEDRCDLEAGRALHVHEEAVGALDEFLELVLSGFNVSVGVQKIVFQNHGQPSKKKSPMYSALI